MDSDALRQTCIDEASQNFNVHPKRIAIYGSGPPDRRPDGTYAYQGTADLGCNGQQDFSCYFDARGRFHDLGGAAASRT